VGNQWSEGLQNGILKEADVVLVLDCDVPWIKSVFKPSPDAKVYHIDCDPLKVNMSLFHLDTELSCQANSKAALQQLNEFISKQSASAVSQTIQERIERVSSVHNDYIAKIHSLEVRPTEDTTITPHFALSRIREQLTEDCIILSEGISNYRPVCDVLMRSTPGTYFTSGATALGWHGGAAVGAKLAYPDKTVISITGDGSFMFSLPENVHWMARRYDAPFLTIILNNRGWKSPMLSAMAVHKGGHSSHMTSDELHVTFDPSCDHAQVAVAAGAGYGVMVTKASEIDEAVWKGLETVRAGRAAVIDIRLPKFIVGDRVG
jgi:acetolactate synthase-1/2/3 large subunit